MPHFPSLPGQLDLPALDARVLARWQADDVFTETLDKTKDGQPWVFYEGPPTANGHPGTHHIEARVFKDVFPRFQTMRGRHVPRKAGWDCHGLPVELAVEKELGFTGKGEIEAYGVAEFNAHCRASVLRYVDEFEDLTKRIGYWVDLTTAYRTMDTPYVESVWWSLKQIHERGLLVEDYRVSPYCPRCQTGLSDHEVAQGYTQLVDPSVYVRLPLVEDGSDTDGADLLVWTTTPWTLISNTAVAVHPELTYARVRTDGRDVLVARELVAAAVGEDAEILSTYIGRDLERKHYRPPFGVLDIPDAHYVVLADYVTTDEGTGLVHQAPAFGAEDMSVARAYGLPVVNPIRTDGTFSPEVPLVGGVFFKTADAALVEDLRSRGVLWRYRPYEHTYPLCWRCDTALLYYALPSWYVRTTGVKDALLRENEATDWHPATIKNGRYGEWLRGNVDWALSRSRYWGTPLPLWRCTDGHVTAVGSLAELSELSGTDQSQLDPHRPFVDSVTLPCPTCGGLSTRVPEVIDAWYDSGAMPFAQLGYPHVPGSVEAFQQAYPADMICEALDQTRGWFYTLMAIGTLLFDESSYKTVLCLGIILDEHGRKMSKHVGNVLDPFELLDAHGADAIRWLMLCGGNPWQPRRVGDAQVAEVVRTVLMTWWNTVSFFTTYANANGWTPSEGAPASHVQDRWVLAELAATVDEVTEAMEAFDAPRAGRRLTGFIDDLSNWYVRRSRRRFWNGDPAALTTLHTCLSELSLLMAPFTPFLADEVFTVLHAELPSAHLQDWPVALAERHDATLTEGMSGVRRLVELGRAARAQSKVKTRQPLARAVLSGPGVDALPAELLAEVAEELNVLAAVPVGQSTTLTTTRFKANFRGLGRRFGAETKAWAARIDAQEVTKTGPGSYTVAGEVLTDAEVTEIEEPAEGLAVATEGAWSVALDLQLTPELIRTGLVRDAVRSLQEGRKNAGLDVSDRIELWWSADGELADALRTDPEWPSEVLATTVVEGHPGADLALHTAGDLSFWLRAAGA